MRFIEDISTKELALLLQVFEIYGYPEVWIWELRSGLIWEQLFLQLL